jgi:hypothetical protein
VREVEGMGGVAMMKEKEREREEERSVLSPTVSLFTSSVVVRVS